MLLQTDCKEGSNGDREGSNRLNKGVMGVKKCLVVVNKGLMG